LAMVVEHWPNLPPNIKAAFMALIQPIAKGDSTNGY
jgi:hypothetical protein